MEAKEFKEKFKVGDYITCDAWKNANRLGCTDFAKIVIIGQEEFCIEDEDGLTTCLISEEDWQHDQEPVEKDLADVERFFVVYKSDKQIKVDIVFGNNDHLIYMKKLVEDMDCHELLTEQEAIERGLNV